MKIKPFPKELIKVALISIVLMLLTAGVLITVTVINLPTDVLRENIALEDAQGLVSFPICIPTYIPTGIDPNPQIIYEADAANVSEETYIRLRYKRIDDQEKVFEVYQKETIHEEMKTEYTGPQLESLRGGATITLVWWIVDPKLLSESETDKIMKQIRLETGFFQTDQIVWWLYEITDPREYRSNMTEWVKDHVEYRILSYLPVEEIKNVTISMIGCPTP